jgi:isochorismate synthase
MIEVQEIREAVGGLDTAVEQDRIVRFFFDLPLRESWDLLPRLRNFSPRLAAWNSQEDASFVAGGVAWDATVNGVERFEQAREHWRSLEASRCDVEATPQDALLPYCLSGFAFSETGSEVPSPLQTHWKGWGDGRLWVPRWVAAQIGNRVRVVVNAPLSKGADPSLVADQILSQVRWLQAIAAGPDQESQVPAQSAQAVSQSGAEDLWVNRVQSAQNALGEGRVRKVVLARSEEYACGGGAFDAIDTARRMRDQQGGCTVYMVRRANGQAFVGASPEELIRRKGRDISTMALAGTRRRADAEGADAALGQELLQSEKDRHEQLLVTQALESALLPVVESLRPIRTPEVKKLADVQHLCTHLRAKITGEMGLFRLADRLHPSPAVGGMPQANALDWIAENEQMDRGWYAGPIGWIRPGGDGLFVVAIRSVLMHGQRASAFAGCGLVASSDPQSEWSESEAKLRPVARALVIRPSDGP